MHHIVNPRQNVRLHPNTMQQQVISEAGSLGGGKGQATHTLICSCSRNPDRKEVEDLTETKQG